MGDAGSPFDEYAEQYERALEQGISVSGENKEFFARGRIEFLKTRLDRLGAPSRVVMDYGCGTGSATPYFLECLRAERLIGVDVSAKSLDVARRTFSNPGVLFHLFNEYTPRGEVDVVFCNGVFHHIPPADRAGALDYVRRALKPGGLFAFCENNPWNPGTQLVMSRIPFDRDAIKISIPEARRLLAAGGFEVLRAETMFYFPNVLRFLRGLEFMLACLPFGAQYLVLSRAPARK